MIDRLCVDEYFMSIAVLVSMRSTCLRRKVGSVLVKDNHIISTGYNGVPKNIKHCTKRSCLRKDIPSGQDLHICSASHSELNSLLQCSKLGISSENCILYVTTQPCFSCLKSIINSGIIKILYLEKYNDILSDKLIKQSKIECSQYKGKVYVNV